MQKLWVHCNIPLSGFCFLVFLVGCSGSGETLHPVEGKVIYKGTPAKGVLLTFHPKDGDNFKTIRPTGITQEDGTFKLNTGQKNGAPAGEYSVTLIWSKEIPSKGKKAITFEFGGPPDTKDFFDGSFADVNKPPFKAQIKAGLNKLEPFVIVK